MLLDALPPESATVTRMRTDAAQARQDILDAGGEDPWAGGAPPDPAERPWSQLSMLMATTVDEVRMLRYVYTAAHTAKGSRPPLPQLVRRPGVGKRDTRPYASTLTAAQRRRLDPRLAELEQARDDINDTAAV